MPEAIELLREQIKQKSMGKVAKELGISKATVSLVSREAYPNPHKVFRKVKEVYGGVSCEIIGVSVESVSELKDVAQLLKECEL